MLLKVTSIINVILLAPLVPRGTEAVQSCRSDFDLRSKTFKFSQALIDVKQESSALTPSDHYQRAGQQLPGHKVKYIFL